MNTILEKMYANNSNYCHVVEVADAYELQNIIDELYNEFADVYTNEEIEDFLTSLEVYATIEENEDEVYNFNIEEYLKELF